MVQVVAQQYDPLSTTVAVRREEQGRCTLYDPAVLLRCTVGRTRPAFQFSKKFLLSQLILNKYAVNIITINIIIRLVEYLQVPAVVNKVENYWFWMGSPNS